MAKIQKQSSQIFGSRYWDRLFSLGKPFTKSESFWVRAEQAWLPSLHLPSVAIVGTRRPTSYGMRFVSSFLNLLGDRYAQHCRPVVVSGGALGTDAWAHECALQAQFVTESWVVGPVGMPNPRSNARLFEKITQNGGALICPNCLEPGAGEGPFRSDWVLRNAFLVARADVVLVPEASERSGTWSSVRWANRLGIPVFALPGSIEHATSTGTNSMISSGYAHPVSSVVKLMDDLVVWGVLPPYNNLRGEGIQPQGAFAQVEQKLCGLGGLQIVDLPGLSGQIGLKLDELCEYLLNEVRKGKLRRVGNGFERRS